MLFIYGIVTNLYHTKGEELLNLFPFVMNIFSVLELIAQVTLG